MEYIAHSDTPNHSSYWEGKGHTIKIRPKRALIGKRSLFGSWDFEFSGKKTEFIWVFL